MERGNQFFGVNLMRMRGGTLFPNPSANLASVQREVVYETQKLLLCFFVFSYTNSEGWFSMKKQYVIFGLGRFGGSITKTLAAMQHEVLAVDINEAKVNEYASIATHAIQANSTEEQVLQEIGVRNFDHAIVAIGNDIQASILTCIILKDMGVRHITVKAMDNYHSRVLEKVGVDEIIHPERDMGIKVAHHLSSNNIVDFLEISPEHSLVEVMATHEMDGKSLAEMNIRAKYGCTILAIKNDANQINISPQAEDRIFHNDILVIFGNNRDIQAFEQQIDQKGK